MSATNETAATSRVAGVGVPSLASLLIALFYGYFAVANFQIQPGALNSPRMTDVLLAGAIPLAVASFASRRHRVASWLGSFLFVQAALCAMIYSATKGDISYFAQTFRVLMALVVGPVLAVYLLKNDRVGAFFVALLVGGLTNVVISFGQVRGMPFFLHLAPADSSTTYVLGEIRSAGLWGHANENMQVIVIAAAAAFPLLWKASTKAIIFLGLVGMGYLATETRAGLLVGLVFTCIFLIGNGRGHLRGLTLFALSIVTALVVMAPGLFFGDRWTASFGGLTVFGQMQERVGSTLQGALLSLSHPFGLLNEERARLLQEATSVRSTHNGYIHLSLVYGPIAAILALSAVVRAALQSIRTRMVRSYQYVIFVTLTMMFFEDASLSIPIVLVVSVICGLIHHEARASHLSAPEAADAPRRLSVT